MNNQEMDVYVTFYDLRKTVGMSRMINLVTGDKLQHCGLLLNGSGISTEFVTVHKKKKPGRFYPSQAVWKINQPQEFIYLGKHFVPFERLITFAGDLHSEDTWSTVYWWFVGRFTAPYLTPPTCATITCQFLRLCGIEIGNFIRPQELYEELTNAANSYSWTSRSREDYASEFHCD